MSRVAAPHILILARSISYDYLCIYQTTNLVNGRFYIGKTHKNQANYNTYLGSGIALKAAISKYGKHNFKREILFECEDENKCYAKEAELVNDSLINNVQCYNMKLGGRGAAANHRLTEKHKNNISNALKGHKHSDKTIEKLRIAAKNRTRPSRECKWRVTYPCGKIETIHNLSKFCRKHKLNMPTLSNRDKTKNFLAEKI